MEIEGIIIQKVAVNTGISKTGEPWRSATYTCNITSPANSGSFVFDVKDGRNNRIDSLNLQPGKAYKLYIGFELNEYNGKFYNRIVCWGARDLANIIESPAQVENEVKDDLPY